MVLTPLFSCTIPVVDYVVVPSAQRDCCAVMACSGVDYLQNPTRIKATSRGTHLELVTSTSQQHAAGIS